MVPTPKERLWTWVSGDSTGYQPAVYGTKGVAAAANNPGGRYGCASWIDGNGNLWIFGGRTSKEGEGLNVLNDLWRFDGAGWTWVSGDNAANRSGDYGTKGVAAATNKPGARSESVSWVDSSGNLWLFGGYGFDGYGNTNYLNDLWKFDGTGWTWVSGDCMTDQKGIYGTKGVAAATNKPGARSESVSWIDSSGNLWLFGGYGFDSGVHYASSDLDFGMLNDLWKFDGTNWTWVSGDSKVNKSGVYGTMGVAADSNKPGARSKSVSWISGQSNLWLFGGNGYDASGYEKTCFNDLWKFDGANWTWISGDSATGQLYTKTGEISTGTDVPCIRVNSVGWPDGNGNLWLFGGNIVVFNEATYSNVTCYLNDLWKFDGTGWTLVAGDNTANKHGSYGTKGVAAATNKPGARSGSVSWTDSEGNLWLFGGYGYDSAGNLVNLNDLWKYGEVD